MSRREIQEIIEAWKACNGNYSEAARSLGIDRRTVKEWVRRGRQPGGYVRWKGLSRDTTAPKERVRSLGWQEENRVATLRRQTGFCSEKLVALFQQEGIKVSISTIHRILS